MKSIKALISFILLLLMVPCGAESNRTFDIGEGHLKVDLPSSYIVQVQLNSTPDALGLAASAKVETVVVVLSPDISVSLTSITSDDEINQPIVKGKLIEPGKGFTLDLSRIGASRAGGWDIIKSQTKNGNQRTETWLYMKNDRAFSLTIYIGNSKDKGLQKTKGDILKSVRFDPYRGAIVDRPVEVVLK